MLERRRRKGSPLDNACKSFRKVVYPIHVRFVLVFWLRTVIRGAFSTKLFARRWRDDLNAELVDGA